MLLFKDLTGRVKYWGFELNPYNKCVSNKYIYGSQCSILWNVENLKISHVDSKVVGNIINILNKKYGKEAPLTVTWGKFQEYLGMKIYFSTAGKTFIEMEDYFNKILEDERECVAVMETTLTIEHLFEVTNIPQLFNNNTKQFFTR